MGLKNENLDTKLNSVTDDDIENKLNIEEKGQILFVEQGVKAASKEVAYEDPTNNGNGQNIVGVAESFWSRLARRGRRKHSHTSFGGPVSLTAGQLSSSNCTISPSLGCRFYPSHVTASMTVAGILSAVINSGVSGDDLIYISKYVGASGGTLELKFEGEVSAVGTGSVYINALPDSGTSNGKFWGSVNGIEETINA